MFFTAGVDMFAVFMVVSRVVKAGSKVHFMNAATGEEIGAAEMDEDGHRVSWVTNWGHGINVTPMFGVNQFIQSIPKGMQVRFSVT